MKKNSAEKALMLFGIFAPFVGVIVAICLLWNKMVSWRDIALMAFFYPLTGFGITIGYHRMLTHRSFEAKPVVKFILLVIGTMAVEGPARLWASTHIKHHANTDKEDDPHSPLKGFWHAHMGWFVWGDTTELDKYGSWLAKDPMVMFVSKTSLVWVVLRFLIPFLIGGWTGLVWGGLVAVFITHHVTWCVNSVCHIWGKRMFDTGDVSKNHFLIGLLALGEGWHNNHHAFPRSAFHGLRWWQIDLSAYIIRGMERLGWVTNVWRIPADSLEARLIKPENAAVEGVKNVRATAKTSSDAAR